MLTTTKDMLIKARAGSYAVPAINTQGGNFEIIRAICLAAEKQKSPIILAHYLPTGAYSGHDWFYEVSKWNASKVSVPVAIHLDHGDSYQSCLRCLEIGFTSIMYDGSALSIEENAKNTSRVIAESHTRGVPVEAEVGELTRLDSHGSPLQQTNVASVQDVEKFLSLCDPDSLAIGIGNAHGYYAEKPDIRLDVLQEVAKLTSLPLVLHGCTGMEESIIRESIKMGISKINFGTQVRYDYLKHLKNAVNHMNHQGHSFKVLNKASDDLIIDIERIITLSGSEGKA